MALELLRFTTAGSVDDGKSTLIGRLLNDCGAIYEDQLDSVRKASRTGTDLALITDGLRAEREQGITIDIAYRHFATPRRRFIIADTPGHVQYTRNMATGASTASLAIILLDARKGVLNQTCRHAFIASLMGIRRLVVAVNKMDLVDYRQDVFDRLCAQFSPLAARLPGALLHFIPISALQGDNIVSRGDRMPWFTGPALLEYLETVPLDHATPRPGFRLPVQYVVRAADGFRGYAGQIAAGQVTPGEPVIVLPSGHAARVQSICSYRGNLAEAWEPQSVTLCLDDHLDVGRGDMIASPQDPPTVTRRFRASLVWMSAKPLRPNDPFLLKHTTQRLCAVVSSVISRIDFQTLAQQPARELVLNDIGSVEISTHRPIFCDLYQRNQATGSFILIDPITNDTMAAGMIAETFPEGARDAVPNGAGPRGLTIWFTGLSASGKTTLSQAVYERLWAMGHRVEVLDGDIVRRNVSRDLGFTREDRDENIRRIGFLAELLTRNGVIVLVSAISPYRAVRDELRARIQDFVEVFVNAPLSVCEQRDVKGLYRKARAGQLPGFTGIDDPYEPPLSPDVECRTDCETLPESVDKVLRYLETRLPAEPR
jgi:bifunctional enzyme CysN/CysC